VLETPSQDYAPEFSRPRRTSLNPTRKMRGDLPDDFEDDLDEDDLPATRRRGGIRLRVRGGLPRTKWGRIAALVMVLAFAGLCAAGYTIARDYVLHDDRFMIPSSSAIEIQGNEHVTRAQLLSIFGGDVERNIFSVPLAERKADLEELPWVEHATVMRLLPNRLRVAVMERRPVAFVRQGNHIGLVDGNGVLLDMPTDVQANGLYSFPVVTGIAATDPASVRAARMNLYKRFTDDLDRGDEKISKKLSEVDLSDPEDIRALIPDNSNEVLVHFGEDNFLDRYKKFEEHLPEWRTQYPKLSSVDMRYEREVVLEMQPGSAVPIAGAPQPSAPDAATSQTGSSTPAKSATPAPNRSTVKGASAHKAQDAHRTTKAKHPASTAHPHYRPPQVIFP
jgi:cell division protein FtsQ